MNNSSSNQLIQTFLYSIKSKETQNIYLKYINYFETFQKQNIESLLALHPKQLKL